MLQELETKNIEAKNVLFEGEPFCEADVPLREVVALCFEGKKEIELDEDGNPYLLIALMAGIPLRKMLLPIDEGITARHRDGALIAHPLENFLPNVRFVPIKNIQFG